MRFPRRSIEQDGEKLTLSEREVWLEGLARCKTNKQIAADRNTSPKTVERQVHEILRKKGFSNRAEAAVHAVKNGLVEE